MKLTDGEKLILCMLSELYQAFDIKGGIDPDFVQRAVLGNRLWALPWKYQGIPFAEQETPEIVLEVLDILEMWDFIDQKYEQLNEDEKMQLDKEAELGGVKPIFGGFDWNQEYEHSSTASFIVEELERFEGLKGKIVNSHVPSLDVYKRMVDEFKKFRHLLPDIPVSALAGVLNKRFQAQGVKSSGTDILH